MKTITIILTLATLILSVASVAAMEDHTNGSHSVVSNATMPDKNFTHTTVVDGVQTEIQIMSLASMKMKDEQDRTHHIMVKLLDDTTKAEIRDALGKIKIINPDGTEQINSLKNYNGIFAANFTFNTTGKYGVICLLKVAGQQKVVKFWYTHGA